MVMKDLTLRRVSQLSKVEYVRCSEILNGYRNDPASLIKITTAILDAPTPKEVAA